jgi:hypothetical protein
MWTRTETLDKQPDCLRYDPTVEGRFELYKRSMFDLLHPKERGAKTTFTDQDIIVDLGIRTWDGKEEKGLGGFSQVRIPQGSHAGFIGGFMHKEFVRDLFWALNDPKQLDTTGRKADVAELKAIAGDC